MKIAYKVQRKESCEELKIFLQTGVRIPGSELMRDEVTFRMPLGWKVENLHPDLFALSVIVIAYRYIQDELVLPFGVSPEFAEVCLELTNIRLSPIDKNVAPRVPQAHYRPGLAFSAGVDSTACISLMPKSTALVFLHRIKPEDEERNSIYRSDFAVHACEKLQQSGHSVFSVDTDMEWIRNPVGFVVDWSNGVPAILLADYLELDSLAWGMVAESAYRIGHEYFQFYQKRGLHKRWGPMFETAGIPFYFPVAGVSEVGTSIIVDQSSYRNIARSCIRGSLAVSCGWCMKCFRKGLLDSAVANKEISNEGLTRLFWIPEAQKHLAKMPIKHENIIAFIAASYKGDHKGMQVLSERVRARHLSVDWMRKWYPKSLDLVPEKYRQYTKQSLLGFLQEMSVDDIEAVEKWDMRAYLESSDAKVAQKALEDYFTEINVNRPKKRPEPFR